MEAREVSLIIPCRNEKKFIKKCLDSIVAQDYPKNRLEVFVIDGMSEDGTREIAESYTKEHTFITLLDNPKKVIPTAMNIGIKNARCGIIMKIDSHAAYTKDYVSKCVKYLIEYDADNVGGIIIALPRKNTLFGKAIVLALSHPFGVGNSLFRIGTKEPVWADTAFSGCYRKDVFDRIGLYDENIARSEDVAINSKLRRIGGKIVLVPEIKSYYYARSSFGEFIRHNFDNGLWVTYPLKYGRVIFSWRHLIPVAFVLGLLGSATLTLMWPFGLWTLGTLGGVYAVANLGVSAQIVIREREIWYLVAMPVVFASLHLSYGSGSLWGMVKVLFDKMHRLIGTR